MVKEKSILGAGQLIRLKEDINAYEELMKDIIGVLGSVMNLGIHSGLSINKLAQRISSDYIEEDTDNSSIEIISADKCENNGNMTMDLVTSDTNYNKDTDLIRFTSTGPLFQISKSILESLKGSFLDETFIKEYRTIDGSMYLDYRGNDASAYYLLDYLNGKKVDFDSLSYEEQLEILDLFEYCGLPIPIELVNCRERRDTKIKKYEEGDEVELIINGNKNDTIKEYLVKNRLWNEYVMSYNNGFIDYNHIEDSLYMNKKYEYIEYINEYVINETVNIEEEKIININKELLLHEIYELFGTKGKQIVYSNLMQRPRFSDSLILENKDMDYQLQEWLGKEKKWKLLFRASEHKYSRDEFHKYCDYKGETVILVKQIGNNNHINIFGGYTDQNWESTVRKYASKEFLFTLSNEHNVPPTQYKHNGNGDGIVCANNWGIVFGSGPDLCIDDDCHKTKYYVCTKACSFTWVDTPQQSSLFVNTAGPQKENHFVVEDYEVWGRL
ncbi:hypothetical protein WA158_007487 [Blastocystis sp. Blastoise]